MKDTLILLIFMLSVLGLFIGVYYTGESNSENSHGSSYERLYEENDGVLTITLEKKDNNEIGNYLKS